MTLPVISLKALESLTIDLKDKDTMKPIELFDKYLAENPGLARAIMTFSNGQDKIILALLALSVLIDKQIEIDKMEG